MEAHWVLVIMEERVPVEVEEVPVALEEPVKAKILVEAKVVYVVMDELAAADEEVLVADEDATPTETEDTTRASIEAPVHTDEAFPRGPSDRSMLTGYASHVAYRV